MINKLQVQKNITALEDMRGLYTQLLQATADPLQKQQFKTMLEEVDRHYQYLNSILNSLF